VRLDCDDGGGICLDALLGALAARDLRSLMVEGGREVITSFVREQRADHLVVTVAPMLVGGVSALGAMGPEGDGAPGTAAPRSAAGFPRLHNVTYRWLGPDLVLQGDPFWGD
jgi:3,4-dihydroxy 2-butanone 4-phosphate synthase/GTP cyclohydrolase II